MAIVKNSYNLYGGYINDKQLEAIDNYKTFTLKDDSLKTIEYFYNNQFVDGRYFLENNESLSSLIQEFCILKSQNWTFYHSKIQSGLFYQWDWDGYSKDGTKVSRGIQVFDNKDRTVFYCSFDLVIDVFKDNPKKYFYSNIHETENEDILLDFRYNKDGSLDTISDFNDTWGYAHKGLTYDAYLASEIASNFVWNEHPYYHTANPFLPQSVL